jgi:DNA-binding transcriptional LysR family regulator
MELNPLQVFLMVATEGSFSRAAEKMLRTQPAAKAGIGTGRKADRPLR